MEARTGRLRCLRWLLPNRDVLAALAREGLPCPPAPSLAQSQPCELRHQVAFCWPHVPERGRFVIATAIDHLDVVRTHRLGGGVVDIKCVTRWAHMQRHDN